MRTGVDAGGQQAVWVLAAISWLVERKRGGPLHAAAEDYGRAARGLHRATVPSTADSRSTRTAAGALLGARLVTRTETRQLLLLLERFILLSDYLARLRETQGRAARALGARHAAEQLAGEHQRRADAASAAVSRAVSSGATKTPLSVEFPPPHRTAPHRTAPHRTAPHRTAPHRTTSGPVIRGASTTR